MTTLHAPALIDADLCVGCTQCRLTCPVGAIAQTGAHCQVDSNACTRCGLCAWVCPLHCISETPSEQE